MYLLDTNVVSALRVPARNPRVATWAGTVALADQFVAAFTIAEIERGVLRKERTDHAQGDVLRRWFREHVLPAFADRVLPFDLAAARILARYPVPEAAPVDDAQIAAVAEANGLTLVTRNVRHVSPLGLRTLDPWHADEAVRPAGVD
ncbi:type II toxin-antitoxin system VapC family toxin [Cellulomonas fimi]|uniref:type II toxin-antitoxin system VapC family toxin n=1 Tax=Cellulomonas fimi TaxID=1708 RepID=UPI002359C278|nr:type II toxin-antitoxin system VapC family toxin [Cellulomonas fimi]